MRTVSGSLLVQVGTGVLSFVTAIVLARLLGAGQYGVYAYGIAWAGLLGKPAVMGLGAFLTRGIAMYEVSEGWGLMRGLLRRAHQAAIAVSLVLAFIAAVVGGLLLDPSVRTTFWLALGLVPIVGLTILRQSAMQGFNQVVRGQLPDSLIRPAILLAAIFAFTLVGVDLGASGAMALNLFAATLGLVVGVILLRRAFPAQLKEAVPAYRPRPWARSAGTLMIASGLGAASPYVAQILLGSIDGTTSVGVYQVAAKVASALTFVLLAVNLSLAPRIARLHASGETQQLQRLVTRATNRATLATLPLFIGLIALRGPCLEIFGSEFRSGGDALIIIACGQLVNVATGSVGALLMMTGHEREAGTAVACGLAATAALSALLVPLLGIEGAALGTSASIATLNLIMLVLVHRRLGIDASVLGNLSRARNWRRSR